MVNLKLRAPAGELHLAVGDHAWCEVSLATREKTYPLGGDSFATVRDRLLGCLEEQLKGDLVGEIAGVGVTWVMSLMENHASFYAADSANGRMLFVQGANGDLLATLTLHQELCSAWRAELSDAKVVGSG